MCLRTKLVGDKETSGSTNSAIEYPYTRPLVSGVFVFCSIKGSIGPWCHTQIRLLTSGRYLLDVHKLRMEFSKCHSQHNISYHTLIMWDTIFPMSHSTLECWKLRYVAPHFHLVSRVQNWVKVAQKLQRYAGDSNLGFYLVICLYTLRLSISRVLMLPYRVIPGNVRLFRQNTPALNMYQQASGNTSPIWKAWCDTWRQLFQGRNKFRRFYIFN